MRWGVHSDKWGRLTPRMAQLIRKRDRKCVDCGAPGEAVHHIRYRMGEENRGEFADPDDVMLVCNACHGVRHRDRTQGLPTRTKGRLGEIGITKVREAELKFWILIDAPAGTIG